MKLRRVLSRLLLLAVIVGTSMVVAMLGTAVPAWFLGTLAVMTGLSALVWVLL
jgi:hypothetical protein